MANIITAQEYREAAPQDKGVLIDVRTPSEYAAGHVPEAVNIPLKEIAASAIRARFGDQPIHLVCQSGARSEQAAQILEKAGLKQVYSVDGGTAALHKAGLPLVQGAQAAPILPAGEQALSTNKAPASRPPDYLVYPASLSKANWIGLRADQEAWRATHPQPKPNETILFDLPDKEGWYANGKGVLSRPERLTPLAGFSGTRTIERSSPSDAGGISAGK